MHRALAYLCSSLKAFHCLPKLFPNGRQLAGPCNASNVIIIFINLAKVMKRCVVDSGEPTEQLIPNVGLTKDQRSHSSYNCKLWEPKPKETHCRGNSVLHMSRW